MSEVKEREEIAPRPAYQAAELSAHCHSTPVEGHLSLHLLLPVF